MVCARRLIVLDMSMPGRSGVELIKLLKADPEVSKAMSAQELEDKFNLDYHFKEVDRMFARVFG